MNLQKLFTCFSSDLAVDLGTANTLIYARGSGVVINEPSVVAINKNTRKIEAVGREAKEMLGRAPGDIVAIEPLREGVIADLEVAEKMLLHFIRQAYRGRHIIRPRVVIGVPGQANAVERRAVEEAAYRAKASKVYLAPEAMAAAIGAGLPINEPVASMVVDIGGGTTDIAVLSLSGIVHSQEVRVAGRSFDEAIIEHIKRKRRLLIGSLTAERIKIELGSALPLNTPRKMEVSGRCLKEGLPKTITVTDKETYEALATPLNIIVNTVREALAHIPPELSGDIIDHGVTLTGGSSLLRNLDRRLMEETGVPMTVDQDALSSVVLGASQMLNDTHLLRRSNWEALGA
ncbi:MAG: rod shape-determining protein [Blastocatellales bacterium]